MKDYPVSAIVAVPRDEKSATILLGRMNRMDSPVQMVEPIAEVRKLMSMVFQIKRLFNANAVLLSISTLLLMGLVVMLSLRLRQREMETMFKLGCSRGTVVMLQVAEMLIIFAVAAVMVLIGALLISWFAADLVRWVSLRS